jgi:RNA polymerase sigma factor (sigma-70 family)
LLYQKLNKMSTVEFGNMLTSNNEFLKMFAFKLTRNSESAKDLMQETIYKALANKDKYNVGSNIKAWMYTIMRNIFINDYRKKMRENVVFDNTPNDFLLNHNQSSVKNSAEMGLKIKDIELAVHKLPEIFKTPFLLYCEGYKYNEISETLHEPLGTIKSRIHFARKLLKGQLERY